MATVAKSAERQVARTRREPVELSEESAAELGRRVSAVGTRLNLGAERLLAALEAVASSTPAGAHRPAESLSAAEEAVLREAGSLRRPMPDLTERASFRTQLLLEQLLHDALTVKEAAQRLGVSESRVRQRIAARTLLAVERAGTWQLPAFQLDGGADLSEVLPAFPSDVHPAAVLLLLDAPASELEVDGRALTPREWLATGGPVSRVVELVHDAYDLP
jgi:excisionase family DNA binding protein